MTSNPVRGDVESPSKDGPAFTALQQDSEFEHVGPEIGFETEKIGHEFMSWDLWRAAIAEFIGMVFFLFFTIGTVASTASYSGKNGFAGLDSARQFMIASVFGSMISILVYAIAPASGGNLNPAVTCALATTKKITPTRAMVYIVAQCAGAFVGCELVKVVSEKQYDAVGGAINQISPGYTVAGACIAEVLGTMLLVFCVMSAVDKNNGHPERVNMKQSHGVTMIGMCVTMAHCVLIPITNCSINPARSFGASLCAGEWPDHWVFWAAPIVGGQISAMFYEAIIKDNPDLLTDL